MDRFAKAVIRHRPGKAVCIHDDRHLLDGEVTEKKSRSICGIRSRTGDDRKVTWRECRIPDAPRENTDRTWCYGTWGCEHDGYYDYIEWKENTGSDRTGYGTVRFL